MKKRCLTLLLALAMCLALLPTALADGFDINKNGVPYAVPGGNLYFDKATGTIVGADEEVIEANIPAAIDGVAVTAIGPDAFSSTQTLVSVTIPNGVTSIGANAFYGREKLTSVTIPNSVTTIGGGAFMITGLTSVTVPDSVTSMGDGVFQNCTSLTSVTLSKNITSIGDSAFMGCGGLTSITIPNSVTSIGDYAFMSTGLTSITIPNSVTSIGDYAFDKCTNLTSVTIGNGVTSMGKYVFGHCDKLSSVTIMPGVTSIWKGAFRDCRGLTSVAIPEGVTTIEEEAFRIDGLTSVAIPASVTSIGAYAFWSTVKDVYYGGSEEQWDAIEIDSSNYGLIKLSTKHYNDVRGKFADMEPNAFYLDAVAWAVDNGVTTGKTAATFAPKENCTHGQILTFLWRAAGEPGSSAQPPIAMKGNEYYYEAAKWAAEKGMIGGDFDPNASCNRAYAVLYIWQASGSPAPSKASPFTDVPANWSSAPAAAWAAEQGITTGTTATTFDPGKICSRGEIVTFLYRAYN